LVGAQVATPCVPLADVPDVRGCECVVFVAAFGGHFLRFERGERRPSEGGCDETGGADGSVTQRRGGSREARFYSARSMLLCMLREVAYALRTTGGGATRRITCCRRSG